MDLTDFTRFTVAEIRRKPTESAFDLEVFGIVSEIGRLELGSRYWLYVDGGFYSPIFDVVNLDRENSTALLDVVTFSGTPELLVGDSFPVLTDYWNPHIYASVLDQHRLWTKTQFRAIDSFESFDVRGDAVRSTPSRPGYVRYYPSTGLETLDAARVVEGGWDHEHCSICNGHIDEKNPCVFIDDTDVYLCDRCYEAFAVPHDLRFVEK